MNFKVQRNCANTGKISSSVSVSQFRYLVLLEIISLDKIFETAAQNFPIGCKQSWFKVLTTSVTRTSSGFLLLAPLLFWRHTQTYKSKSYPSIESITHFDGVWNGPHSSRFLSFSRRRDGTSQQASVGARLGWAKKVGRGGAGKERNFLRSPHPLPKIPLTAKQTTLFQRPRYKTFFLGFLPKA